MTVLTELPGGYVIDDDRSRLDLDVIWRFLHEESYWARDRTRPVVERGIAHAFPVGAYAMDGSQAGFAMAVTDHAVFALLANVFVLRAHRGRGLGEGMVRALLEHPELATVTRWILSTDDAHGLYAKFGFRPAPQTGAAMELRRPPPADR